jgi:tetratricopeptide (TPR) repeat protein
MSMSGLAKTREDKFSYYKKAMELEPDYYLPHMLAGRHLVEDGELQKAIPNFHKAIAISSAPGQFGRGSMRLVDIYLTLGDFASAAHHLRLMKEAEPENFWAINTEIQLLLARGNYDDAREIVHRTVPSQVGQALQLNLLAFYEMLVGDLNHAKNIYKQLERSNPNVDGRQSSGNLFYWGMFQWGTLGAVNLAWLYSLDGQHQQAKELLDETREYTGTEQDRKWATGSDYYLMTQMAAIEGRHDAAIEHFKKAIQLHWTRAWYTRIDPITSDLRKDERFVGLLEELESNLLDMRERVQLAARPD